jgi:hypothetical protein
MIQLPHALESLIESRLDTIDRMLVGRVPRPDRLAIVKEVESQIYDLLQESGPEEPSRESVLAALARLDPPEAYLPDETIGQPASPNLSVSPRFRVAPVSKPRNRQVSRASGVLGLIAILLVVLSPFPYLLGLALQSEIVMLFGWGLEIVGVLALGIVGIVLGIYARLQDAWAITGVVLCGLSLIAVLISSAMLLVLFFAS